MAKLIHQADRIARRSVETAANDRQKAVTLALDVDEPLLNEADVLLTAATIIVRQSKEAENAAPKR